MRVSLMKALDLIFLKRVPHAVTGPIHHDKPFFPLFGQN